MAKLAVAWPLKRRFVTAVIIGVKNADQLAANLEVGDWDMPDDAWQTLEEKTRPAFGRAYYIQNSCNNKINFLPWYNGLDNMRYALLIMINCLYSS